jgi:hypothetical protein
MDHSRHQQPGKRNGKLFRARWVFLGFIAIAAYFLITEHRAHLSGLLYYLPFLLLLACPLMHLFMHGGHGNHDDAHKHGVRTEGDRK